MNKYEKYVTKYADVIEFVLYLVPLILIIHINLVGRYQTKLMFSDIFIYYLSLFCASYALYKLFGNNILKTTASIGISTLISIYILGIYDFFSTIVLIFGWAFVIGLIPGFSVTILTNPYKTHKTITKTLKRIFKNKR